MKNTLMLTVAIMFSGCSVTSKHTIVQSKVAVEIKQVKSLPSINGKPQLARTTVGNGFCVIELTDYPKCLQHEMRHCFEFNWHEGRETTADCV